MKELYSIRFVSKKKKKKGEIKVINIFDLCINEGKLSFSYYVDNAKTKYKIHVEMRIDLHQFIDNFDIYIEGK